MRSRGDGQIHKRLHMYGAPRIIAFGHDVSMISTRDVRMNEQDERTDDRNEGWYCMYCKL